MTPVLTTSAASSGTSDPLVETLDNGLQVVVQEHRSAPVASLRVYVRAGSIYEGRYAGSGISHYVEHLVSGGTTENRDEEETTGILERLGNANNAYTSKDHTAYYITTAPEHLGEAIELFADWMQNCTFEESEFEREKGVILEEVGKSKEEPSRVIHRALYETMFRRSPTQYPVIGHESLVEEIEREDVVAYYEQMYAPNNMIVVAAGDFDAEQAVAEIEEAFGQMPRRSLDLPTPKPEPTQMGQRRRHIQRKELGKEYFHLGFHTVPLDDPDLYPLDVLSNVLSGGRSSRLVAELREKKGLVSGISTYSHTPDYGAGVFGITGTCDPGDSRRVVEEIVEILDEIGASGVTDEELDKAARQEISSNVFGRRTAESVAGKLGINLMSTGNPTFHEKYVAGIQAVTSDEVAGVTKEYLHKDNLTLITMGPEQGEENQTEEAEEETTQPEVREFTLDNGLKVLVRPSDEVPLVYMQWISLGGARLDPEDLAGLSRVTAHMMTRGTDELSAEQIAGFFDERGGRLSPITGNNTLGLKANVLSDDFADAFRIFTDLIRRPSFPPEELKTVRQQTLSAISGRRDDWQSELSHLFKKSFFGDHPYSHGPLGNRETVEAIERNDVTSFYEQHVVPDRSVLTIYGDISAEEAIQTARDAYSGFNRDSPELPDVPDPEKREEPEEMTLPVQRGIAAIQIGYPGLSIHDTEDRYPMEVMDAVLSGSGYPGGWLHNDLRGGERDLVYVVHGRNFIGLENGYYAVLAATSPAHTDQVIEIVRDNIERIRNEKVGETELQNARNMVVTMHKLRHQTNSAIALEQGLNELYGLGYTFGDQYRKRIREVTAEDVQRVARKYLKNPLILRLEPSEIPSP
ncbi:MAG: M16 family metallopeptidase [Planctomycetota bacterium]